MCNPIITRIRIFIDYDNFTIAYSKKHNIDRTHIDIWPALNQQLINDYKDKFVSDADEKVIHSGTYLCVGMSDYLLSKEEQQIKKSFQKLDREQGFIVKYGYRTAPYRENGEFRLGKEKGVDSEIICQMLMGAFLDHYDVCLLLSDDNDYLPALQRVQDYFGKKVIQVGFKESKLRNQAYGHVALEAGGVLG